MTKLLMISGDRSILRPKTQSAFALMLEEFRHHFERIDILCPRGIVELREARALHGNVFIHASPSGRLGFPFFVRSTGEELYRLHHHDVFTVHDYPPFQNGIGARMLRSRIGIPGAMEMHHIVGWPAAASPTEWIGRHMTKFYIGSHARHFQGVRVVNETVKTQLAAWGVPEHLLHVVPSVYLDHTMIDAAGHEPKIYDLVFAARLVENKGLMRVINAVAEMPGVTLRVLGDGPLRRDAEAHVRTHGIADRVTFSGWVPDAVDFAKAVASGRVFVMNSTSEGNPRVAVEAMALGLPVLSTKVGIMPDILRDGVNGVFTDGSETDISAKAMTLLSDHGRIANMGTEARKVMTQFEKKAAIKAYADFLKSLK